PRGALVLTRLGDAAGIRRRGPEQMLRAILRILRNQPARKSAWPTVFIIQPRKHRLGRSFFGTDPHRREKLLAQIFRREPRAGMNVEPAEAHLLELLDLPQQ